MSKFKKIFGWGFGFIKRMSWPKRILLGLVVMCLLMFVAIEVTGTPEFCGSCHIMDDYHASWETSTHNEVSCLKCHTQPGLTNYAKAKIQGFAQSVDCMVGRVGTKPSGTVADASCLRSGCHDTEKLATKKIDFWGVKFTHEKHVSKTVEGIVVSCGTCHSHYEGQEHFSVNSEICFTCHFIEGEGGKRVVETDCRSCHEVPEKVIKRGMVEVNHAEFVSYQANCDDSCHKRQIEIKSKVDNYACLGCHDFTKHHEDMESTELHKIHSTGEKVECFECHGNVSHAKSEGGALSGMMECENCHSDVHDVQGSFYAAETHPQGKDDSRVLGPMYLTHVECSDCHIGKEPIYSEGISSTGTVARPVPEACDRCHEKGTGEKFIPFWQDQTKKLHAKTSRKLEDLRVRMEMQAAETKIEAMKQAISEAKAILDTVEADGSWGVHNLKYTEALLLKANEIINDVQ